MTVRDSFVPYEAEQEPVRWGKVQSSGPPWQVRLAGDPTANLLVDFAFGAPFGIGDSVLILNIAPGTYAASQMSRSGSAFAPAPTAWQTPQWVSGNTYRCLYGGLPTTAAVTAGRIYFSPYSHSHPGAIDAVVLPNSATETQNATVGIYASDSDGLPGALIEAVEDIPDSLYHPFALAADRVLSPGTTYYLAALIQEASTWYVQDSTNYYPVFHYNLGHATRTTAISGTTEGRFYVAEATYSNGLPDPFPNPADWVAEQVAGGGLPMFGVRAA